MWVCVIHYTLAGHMFDEICVFLFDCMPLVQTWVFCCCYKIYLLPPKWPGAGTEAMRLCTIPCVCEPNVGSRLLSSCRFFSDPPVEPPRSFNVSHHALWLALAPGSGCARRRRRRRRCWFLLLIVRYFSFIVSSKTQARNSIVALSKRSTAVVTAKLAAPMMFA